MSDIENEDPSTNANGKRVNALELGPRKKTYIILFVFPLPLHRSDKLLLA
jgi:hypothetical protein